MVDTYNHPIYFLEHKSLNNSYSFFGVEHSMECFFDAIKEHGPFDGLLAFSQGAVATRLFDIYTR